MDGASQTKIQISGFENPTQQQAEFQGVAMTRDYEFLYYVVPAIFAAGLGVYFYARKKSLLAD
jgi:hypothetical protein